RLMDHMKLFPGPSPGRRRCRQVPPSSFDGRWVDRPVCGHANGTDAEFCFSCGHRFALGPTQLAGHVPHETLVKISQARTDPRMPGERHTVTLLLADIEGATAARRPATPTPPRRHSRKAWVRRRLQVAGDAPARHGGGGLRAGARPGDADARLVATWTVMARSRSPGPSVGQRSPSALCRNAAICPRVT